MAKNPSVTRKQCDIKRCLSNPLLLKGMDKLLRDVDDVLKSLKIRYWIEGGTVFGARRFQAFLPWDDDVDIDLNWSRIRTSLGNISARH